jgi:dCMP deaminase
MWLTLIQWVTGAEFPALPHHPKGKIQNFPRGVEDSVHRYMERELKYQMVVHAELNAILSAGEDVSGMTLYCTLHPCCECAKAVIQAGITSVVVPYAEPLERYAESMANAQQMFIESGVLLRQIR